jgi:hypothetical protein
MTPDDFLRAITPGMQQPDGKLCHKLQHLAYRWRVLLLLFIINIEVSFLVLKIIYMQTTEEIAHLVLVPCKFEVFDVSYQKHHQQR